MQTEEVTFSLKDAHTKDIRVYCFVCTGNTCRSPMAAAVLNHYGAPKGVFAFSRGIAAFPGDPITKEAADALCAAGIPSDGHNDYENHRARQITEEDLANCAGVFALTARHAEALTLAFPEYAGKIRLLGEIADPYGGDAKVYADCLAAITDALKSVFPFLFDDADRS